MRLAALAAFLLTIPGAMALAGEPVPWQVGFQDPASPTMERIIDFHTHLLWLISAISLFVLALLVWVIYRYRESRNPTPPNIFFSATFFRRANRARILPARFSS